MRKLINVVITSSIMIVVVMILRKFFGSRVKSGAICVLWALVAMRLLIPVQLFGNVVNVTDYLTKNVINLQSRDITTEVQEKSDSVSDSQIGDDLQAGSGAQSDGNLQAANNAQVDGNIQTGSSAMSDSNAQIGSYATCKLYTNYMADWYGSYVCCCSCEQSYIYRQTYVIKKVSRQKR